VRRHERQRRRDAQSVAVGADGPGDPLDSIRIAVRFDAPAHRHCGCFASEHAPRKPTDGRCCDCGAVNPDLEPTS
jgi:hypothetical protein